MRLTRGMLHEIMEAFERSTKSDNVFESAIGILEKKLGAFEADGELCFVFENAIFTTPGTDPFDMPWRPAVLWRDGSGVSEF